MLMGPFSSLVVSCVESPTQCPCEMDAQALKQEGYTHDVFMPAVPLARVAPAIPKKMTCTMHPWTAIWVLKRLCPISEVQLGSQFLREIL